jgi:hypothetical protein
MRTTILRPIFPRGRKYPRPIGSTRKPAQVDSANDWFVEIYDGRFIGGNYKVPGQPDELLLYADLRDEGTNFVTWLPFDEQRPAFDPRRKAFVDAFTAKWHPRAVWADRLDPGFLSYRYEDHQAESDPLRLAAEAAVRSPLFKSTINVTLAVRKALRRYPIRKSTSSVSCAGSIS